MVCTLRASRWKSLACKRPSVGPYALLLYFGTNGQGWRHRDGAGLELVHSLTSRSDSNRHEMAM